MKKTLAIIAMVVGAGTMNAQLTSKKGENYLPQSGDWSIGVDGSSAIGYFGNMLNNSADNGMSFDYSNGANMITGKLFISDTKAYRAGVRIGMNTSTSQVASLDSAGVYDEVKTSENFIGLSAGMEYRRGSTRLQGYYGGAATLAFGSAGSSTTYAKPNVLGQVTETKSGATVGFGVRGFIGVEYFVLPKISIAGEFGWGLGFVSQGAGSVTAVSLDANGNTVSTTTDGPTGSDFSLDTDNAGGALMINFHF
jgi:hypothetical protein